MLERCSLACPDISELLDRKRKLYGFQRKSVASGPIEESLWTPSMTTMIVLILKA